MADEAFVYVIAVAGEKAACCKVGMSKSPRKRLASLQRESAAVLCLIETISATADVAKAIERYAHWLLKEHHKSGEWFSVRPGFAIRAVKAAQLAVSQGHEAPFRIAGAGRPHLRPTIATVSTTIRLRDSMIHRVQAVAGSRNMAAFIREAVEEKLAATERLTSRKPNPISPDTKGEGEC